tara:strand:+ start:143 stop:280 length:138 start_codon:yes stop_codon:yes gene_type:complete
MDYIQKYWKAYVTTRVTVFRKNEEQSFFAEDGKGCAEFAITCAMY